MAIGEAETATVLHPAPNAQEAIQEWDSMNQVVNEEYLVNLMEVLEKEVVCEPLHQRINIKPLQKEPLRHQEEMIQPLSGIEMVHLQRIESGKENKIM